MTTVTLQLKNKVKGFQNFDDYGSSDKNSPSHNYYIDEDDFDIPGNSNSQRFTMLKNRIKILETTLQKTREEAFQAGYDEGKEAARYEAEQQIEELSEEFSAMVESLKIQYDKVLEKMNEPLIKLAVKIAEKILGRELRHQQDYNEILIKQIKQLLGEVVDQNKVTVHVNPNQIDWIVEEENLKELNIPSQNGIQFVRNEKLKPGECLMETEDYIIEGVLSRELDNLENEILNGDAKWKH